MPLAYAPLKAKLPVFVLANFPLGRVPPLERAPLQRGAMQRAATLSRVALAHLDGNSDMSLSVPSTHIRRKAASDILTVISGRRLPDMTWVRANVTALLPVLAKPHPWVNADMPFAVSLRVTASELA